MRFNIRYIDTSDWAAGKTGDHWSPQIDLESKQYILGKDKINMIYSVVGSSNLKIEDATFVINKLVYINFRRLKEYIWEKWDYETSSLLDYATDVAIKIKHNIEHDIWNPWDHIPSEINLVIVRRVHHSEILWINNLFYLGKDPEADLNGDILDL